MESPIDERETARTRARYNRLAPVYDQMERFSERNFAPKRHQLWSLVPAGHVLEVGVGTGKNFPYHPAGAQVTGIDLSDRMLEQSRRRAVELEQSVELCEMDAQQLDFPDGSFDAAAASFVYCSVPDPVRGLRELRRVVRPGGRIVLLEHVRIDHPGLVGKLMDAMDPVVVRIMGAHINRRTVDNVRRSGLDVEWIHDLGAHGLLKLIVARS